MVLKYSSLKEKDLEYMRFILKNSTVTAQQIFLKFQENNIYAVYRRLRKLKERGFVKHEMLAHKVGVYIGTKEARDLVEAKVTIPSKPSLYTIQHELLLTDLALYYEFYLKKQGISFDYKSERELRYLEIGDGDNGSKLKKYNEKRERIPDAVFFIKSNGGVTQKVWIELEINKKEQKRYDEKFKEVFEPALSSGDYAAVWYFSDSQKIKNGIEKAKSKLLNGNKITVYGIPEVILKDKWEEVLPNESRNDGKTTGEGESGPGD